MTLQRPSCSFCFISYDYKTFKTLGNVLQIGPKPLELKFKVLLQCIILRKIYLLSNIIPKACKYSPQRSKLSTSLNNTGLPRDSPHSHTTFKMAGITTPAPNQLANHSHINTISYLSHFFLIYIHMLSWKPNSLKITHKSSQHQDIT